MITLSGVRVKSLHMGRKIVVLSIITIFLIIGVVALFRYNSLSTVGCILIFYFFGLTFLWLIKYAHYNRFLSLYGVSILNHLDLGRDFNLVYQHYENQGLSRDEIVNKIYKNLDKIEQVLDSIKREVK